MAWSRCWCGGQASDNGPPLTGPWGRYSSPSQKRKAGDPGGGLSHQGIPGDWACWNCTKLHETAWNGACLRRSVAASCAAPDSETETRRRGKKKRSSQIRGSEQNTKRGGWTVEIGWSAWADEMKTASDDHLHVSWQPDASYGALGKS